MEGALGILLVAGAVVAALAVLRSRPAARRGTSARHRSTRAAGAGDAYPRGGRPGAALERLSPASGSPPVTSAPVAATRAGPGVDAPGSTVEERTPLGPIRAALTSAAAAAAGAPGGFEDGADPRGSGTGGSGTGGSGTEGSGKRDRGAGGPASGSGGARHRGAEESAAAGAAPSGSRRPDGTPARSRLFHPGVVDGPGAPHHGPYACLHLHTTGLRPTGDRILEVAVVRCSARGDVATEWSTVLDPEGHEVSAGWLHGLTTGALQGAPSFADVASDLLIQLEGAVVVAHNADLVEAFLAGALLRRGMLSPPLPVLPLARFAAVSLRTPNTRLASLGAVAGRRRALPSSALADARIVAAVLPHVLGPLGDRIRYPVAPIPHTEAKHRRRPALRTRAPLTGASVPSGYLADLLAAVPASAAEQNDPRLAAYLDALMAALPRGIAAEEVRDLTGMAVRSGYRADDIRAVHQRILESLRATAFGRGQVGQPQVRHLRAVAHSLGIPGYFDDLVTPPAPPAPPPGSGSFSRPVRKPPPPAPPAQSPRCGHCLGLGHYTAQCPQLRRRRGGGSVGPVGGVPGFGPVDPISPI